MKKLAIAAAVLIVLVAALLMVPGRSVPPAGGSLWERMNEGDREEFVASLLRCSAGAMFYSVEALDSSLSARVGEDGGGSLEVFARLNAAKISLARTANLWMEASSNPEFLSRVRTRVDKKISSGGLGENPVEMVVIESVSDELINIYMDMDGD